VQHADLTVTIAAPLAEADERLRAALAAEGFGVLTEIDVEGTLRTKLGDAEADEVGPTRILGACNPVLAHRAITTARSVALLLPCNVVVREVAGGTEVAIADPDAMVTLAGDALDEIACDARERLVRVAEALRA
jgi:uncharacterized protein (DUF302 family)